MPSIKNQCRYHEIVTSGAPIVLRLERAVVIVTVVEVKPGKIHFLLDESGHGQDCLVPQVRTYQLNRQG